MFEILKGLKKENTSSDENESYKIGLSEFYIGVNIQGTIENSPIEYEQLSADCSMNMNSSKNTLDNNFKGKESESFLEEISQELQEFSLHESVERYEKRNLQYGCSFQSKSSASTNSSGLTGFNLDNNGNLKDGDVDPIEGTSTMRIYDNTVFIPSLGVLGLGNAGLFKFTQPKPIPNPKTKKPKNRFSSFYSKVSTSNPVKLFYNKYKNNSMQLQQSQSPENMDKNEETVCHDKNDNLIKSCLTKKDDKRETVVESNPHQGLVLDKHIFIGPIVGQAVSIKNSDANEYDEVALRHKKGDIIDIICKPLTGFWIGRLNGKIGDFKFNYVKELPKEDHKVKFQVEDFSVGKDDKSSVDDAKNHNQDNSVDSVIDLDNLDDSKLKFALVRIKFQNGSGNMIQNP